MAALGTKQPIVEATGKTHSNRKDIHVYTGISNKNQTSTELIEGMLVKNIDRNIS